ncbi:MAG: Rieske (2Fe-2S) protein [Desulfomonile tiedjei]|nr:Rieske (2Fe-2S) protein [Desulfomonile tiedjei]
MSVVIGFLKALAGICDTKPLDPDHWELNGNQVLVKIREIPELQSPGGAVYLQGKGLVSPVLIVRGDGGNYHCFSNRCTHMGRRLDPVKGKPEIRCCSVGHSTFDYQGNKMRGPAKKSVQTYDCHVENNDLVIMI